LDALRPEKQVVPCRRSIICVSSILVLPLDHLRQVPSVARPLAQRDPPSTSYKAEAFRLFHGLITPRHEITNRRN